MKKIKEFIKKNYLIVLIIIFVIISITMGVLLFFNNNKETKILKENTYTMYTDNPIIKFTVKESFYECTKKNATSICSDIKTEVTDYQAIEEGESNNIDFKGLTFPQAIAKLIEVDSSKPLTIITNYEITSEQLKEQILNHTAQKEFDIIVQFEQELHERDILEKPKDTYYTITFDSDGGSNIDSIVVKEGETIEKPGNPTKNGYTFKEWQVENTSFDFTTKIYKNTTLKAVWEKKESSTTAPTSNPTPTKKDTINLNDNVVATEYTKSIYEECSFYVFATNLKQLFPKVENHWCPFPKEQCFENELPVDDYNANFNSIQFDTKKEQEVINLLKQYKNGNYAGIVVNSYNLNDQHFLTMDYKYLQIQDTYYIEGTDAAKKIQNLLKSATRLYGNCGATDFSSTKVLTEDLCNEYHLKCDRW